MHITHITPALIVHSLRQRVRGKKSHLDEMGVGLDDTLLTYIEHMGGIKRPTADERREARNILRKNIRRAKRCGDT